MPERRRHAMRTAGLGEALGLGLRGERARTAGQGWLACHAAPCCCRPASRAACRLLAHLAHLPLACRPRPRALPIPIPHLQVETTKCDNWCVALRIRRTLGQAAGGRGRGRPSGARARRQVMSVSCRWSWRVLQPGVPLCALCVSDHHAPCLPWIIGQPRRPPPPPPPLCPRCTYALPSPPHPAPRLLPPPRPAYVRALVQHHRHDDRAAVHLVHFPHPGLLLQRAAGGSANHRLHRGRRLVHVSRAGAGAGGALSW